MNFKQRMMIYIPLAIIAILGIYLFPEPYNRWITPAVLGLYWIILIISHKILEKKKGKGERK